MNDFIMNSLVVSLSICVSNIFAQYIIEKYIRLNHFITREEFEKFHKLNLV
jgi:hypothetical protein